MTFPAAFGISPVTSGQEPAPAVDNPLVSIIIPCYNGEAFLRETLETAFAQTYPHVEIIVVDDGSIDRSGEIAQSFPVRYVYQQNGGLVRSRNRGIQESRGSYLVFLDADDRLKPDAIETGLGVLKRHPECAVTVGDHVFISADGSFLANSGKQCLQTRHYEALLQSNFIEMISSVLFRKSVFDTVGLFDPDLRASEDYDLYLRIARRHAICCHSAVIAEYRLHSASMSRNSELMLTVTLGVLYSQREYTYGNVERRSAFMAGAAKWRRQYGRQLTMELARSFSTLPLKKLSHKFFVLLRYYPQGIGMFLALKAMPNLVQRERERQRRSTPADSTLLERLQASVSPSGPHPKSTIG